MLRKRKTSITQVESKEGQRNLLRSSRSDTRCPSLDFNPNSELVTEDMALEYLAEILVDIYLAEIEHEQKSGDLLPGIDKGTS